MEIQHEIFKKTEQEILERLVRDYQETNKDEIFDKIIKHVHDLILYEIYQSRKKCPKLKRFTIDELYHISCIGIYKAVKASPEKEDGEQIISRMISYMKSYMSLELRILFPNNEISIEGYDFSKEEVPVGHELEIADMLDLLKRISKEGEVINEEDFELLKLKYIFELSYDVIAKSLGYKRNTVQRKIENAINRLRFEMRRRNLIEN